MVGVGEQLYAVQFRRVKFDFRKSDTVEASKLAQEHVWLRYKDVRTGGDDEGVDIVESDLDDDLELEAGLWDMYTHSDNVGESVLCLRSEGLIRRSGRLIYPASDGY